MEDVRTTYPPAPPPSPENSNSVDGEDGDKEGDDNKKATKVSEKRKDPRIGRPEGPLGEKRTNTMKCCNRCGTWNHVRRLACTTCLASREEMGKGKNRALRHGQNGRTIKK